MTMTRTQMVEFDTRELAVYHELWKAEATLPMISGLVHRHAGDQQVSNGYGRPKSWKMTEAEARGRLAYLASEYDYPQDPSSRVTPSELLARAEGAEESIGQLQATIGEMEARYRQDPWSRYFPCLSRDGHIHSSLRGCQTVYWDTQMGWAVEMSGLTADQAIHGAAGQFEGLGETLCSVCFPGAPAEWCRTRSEVTRAEREAAKAARQEAKFVKGLRDGEQFRSSDGERVTTVAACKDLVRAPAKTAVELEWYSSEDAKRKFNGNEESRQRIIGNVISRLAAEQLDAVHASAVLFAREAAAPGTGWTLLEADKAVASATRRARVAYFK